jgi:hypothetical protein
MPFPEYRMNENISQALTFLELHKIINDHTILSLKDGQVVMVGYSEVIDPPFIDHVMHFDEIPGDTVEEKEIFFKERLNIVLNKIYKQM